MAKKAGYVAAVLDQETQAQLRELTVHNKVFCTHVTLAHKPSEEVFRRYAGLIGKTIDLVIDGMVVDECGQALKVKLRGAPCENKHPHITLSCAEGTPPVYSNELLDREKRIIGFTRKVRANVQFIRFS